MKLTRRELVAAIAPAAVMGQAQPQTTQQPQDPLSAAKARVKGSSDVLAKIEIPMATEPAFQFRA
jgi:hypothetical protein